MVAPLAGIVVALVPSFQAAPEAPKPPLRFCRPRLLTAWFATEPCRPLVADLDGDGFADLIAVNPDAGAVDVARSVRGGKYLGPVAATRDLGAIVAAATRAGANGRFELVIERKEGGRRVVSFGDDGQWSAREEAPPPAVSSAAVGAAPSSAEDASSTSAADAESIAREMESLAARFPGCVLASGDVSGDRHDDLIVFRRDDAWRQGRDVLVCVAYRDGDPDPDGDGLDSAAEQRWKSDPLDSDTDHDGLLDGWEAKGEGSIDLPALGASPSRQDCFVYVQRYSETDGAGCAQEVARAVKTWAELPNANPDGSTGIALHPIWLPPLPPGTPGRAWWDLGNENLPRAARGLAHYMNVYAGGGGQAAELGDMGGCGSGALWACFLHEFGHQVGLSHAGGPLPGACPTYTSLMSYSYSYSFNDDGGQIHYSRGEFAGLTLNESRLAERLPFPLAKVSFLGRGPYSFNVQADGDATRVDWNRDGRFDEGIVRADVDDVYGVGTVRFGVGKTVFAPTLLDFRGRLFLVGASREKRLYRREIHDVDKFEPESWIDSVKPTGDPAAVVSDAGVLLLVPTEEGIAALSASEPEGLDAASATLLPETKGLAVSAALFGGKPLVMLWKDDATPVTFVTPIDAPENGTTATGAPRFAAPKPLGALVSTIPPAAAQDPATGELVVGFGAKRGEKGERLAWRLARMREEPDGSFAELSQRSVGDENCGWYGNARPMLLIEHGDAGHPATTEGRIHFVGRGTGSPPNFNQCTYEAITIGDATRNDGWRLRRYCDEWSTTRSPIGACFHRGASGELDMVVAYRWFGNVHGDEDDDVHVLFRAFGISDADMRDFDDVAQISEIGLQRSILWRDPAAK
jgi:hypothetical protein